MIEFIFGVFVGAVGMWVYSNLASAKAIGEAVEKEVKDHID